MSPSAVPPLPSGLHGRPLRRRPWRRRTLRRSGLLLAAGVALAGTLAAVQLGGSPAGAALGLDGNGSLVMYPNADVSWSRWYSGSVVDQGNALRVLTENDPALPLGRNVASAIAEVPVGALPTVPFVIHTRTTSLSPEAGSPTNPSKRHSVLWIGADGLAIRTDQLSLGVDNRDVAPAGYQSGDTIGASPVLTPPAGTVRVMIGLADYFSPFYVRSVTLDPVGVAAPAGRPTIIFERGDSLAGRGVAPAARTDLLCNGTVAFSAVLQPGQTVLIDGAPWQGQTCRPRAHVDPLAVWVTGLTFPTHVIDGVPSGDPFVAGATNYTQISADLFTLVMHDEVARAAADLTSGVWNCVLPVAIPTMQGFTLEADSIVDGIRYSSMLVRFDGAECDVTVNRPLPFTYRLNDGPIQTATAQPLHLTGFRPGAGNVFTVNAGVTNPTTTTSTTIAPTSTQPPTTIAPTTTQPSSTTTSSTTTSSTTTSSTTTSSTTTSSTTQPPTTIATTTTQPSSTTSSSSSTTLPGGLALSVSPAVIRGGDEVTLRVTGAAPGGGRVDFTIGGIVANTAIVSSDGSASSTFRWYAADGTYPVVATWVRYPNGAPVSTSVSGTLTVGTPSSTSSTTTTSTSVPGSTSSTSTSSTSTSTSTPTTLPGGFTVVASPATVRVGSTIELRATGLGPVAGRVDFTVDGIPVGTAVIDAGGTAVLRAAIWSLGPNLSVVASAVTYRDGAASTRTARTTLTVTA